MVVVSRSIHVDAPVDEVFALMADPAARTQLNPLVSAGSAEIEGGGPVDVGCTCHFRFVVRGRQVEYRAQIREFEPPRRIVSLAQAAVPFEVCIETEPEGQGTRLTQTERFEPTDAMLDDAIPDKDDNAVVKFAQRLYLFLDTDKAMELRQQQERFLAQKLAANMDTWLTVIKRHIEDRHSDSAAASRLS